MLWSPGRRLIRVLAGSGRHDGRDEQRRSGEDLAREGGQRPGVEIGFGEPSTFEPEEDPEQAPETDPDDARDSSTAMGQAGGALMG